MGWNGLIFIPVQALFLPENLSLLYNISPFQHCSSSRTHAGCVHQAEPQTDPGKDRGEGDVGWWEICF